MAVLGYDGLTLAKHITIGGEGQNLRDASTADQPDKVAPRDGNGPRPRRRPADWRASPLVLSCGSPEEGMRRPPRAADLGRKPMPGVKLTQGREVLRPGEGHPRRLARDRPRRLRRLRRPLRLRQVHAAADDRRPRGDHRRPDRDRGPRRHRTRSRPGAASPWSSSPTPSTRTSRVYENMAFSLRLARRGRAEIEKRVGEAARILQLEDAPAEEALAALRRPAPARGDRPRHRAPAQGLPLRRAALQPRRRAARADAPRARPPAPRDRRDDDLRHPRPGRGDDAGRQDLRPAVRRRPPGRSPARALRQPRQPLRRRLHRLARHELPHRAGRRPDRDRHHHRARGRRTARLSPRGCASGRPPAPASPSACAPSTSRSPPTTAACRSPSTWRRTSAASPTCTPAPPPASPIVLERRGPRDTGARENFEGRRIAVSIPPERALVFDEAGERVR